VNFVLGKTMTQLDGAKPRELACPACGQAVYRLTLGDWWARWLARLTKRRPYACAQCGWQGWLIPPAPHEDVIDHLPWFRARPPKRRKDERG
jgi:predicted RNA-binding Zn-ribbon protein involved in translation (DUF1610 family)